MLGLDIGWTQPGTQVSALSFGNIQGLGHQVLSLTLSATRQGKGGVTVPSLSLISETLRLRIPLCTEDSE